MRRADNLNHSYVPIVMKSESLHLLELSEPAQVSTGTVLPSLYLLLGLQNPYSKPQSICLSVRRACNMNLLKY